MDFNFTIIVATSTELIQLDSGMSTICNAMFTDRDGKIVYICDYPETVTPLPCDHLIEYSGELSDSQFEEWLTEHGYKRYSPEPI